MTDSTRRVLLAKVVAAFGIRGEVKLESWTEPRDALFRYRPWSLVTASGTHSIAAAQGRLHTNGTLVARLPGIDTRDQAERLVGAEIWIERAQLPPTAPGEYYWVDLEGLAVTTLEGVELGTISQLFNHGAGDVIAVAGDRVRYLPYTPDVVREVDLEAGRMRVDWDPDF